MKSEDCCDLLLSFGMVSAVVILLAVIGVILVFGGPVRHIDVSVDDASLKRFELSTSPPEVTSLSYNLSLTLVIRNPNWAHSLKNTKPLEALYKFDDQTFDRVQIADKGDKHPAGKTRVYHLSPAGTTAFMLGHACESEFCKQGRSQRRGSSGSSPPYRLQESATGTFEVEVAVVGEVQYTWRKPKCKVEASCPLKLQLAPPGTAAVVFQKVKCKLTMPENKYC